MPEIDLKQFFKDNGFRFKEDRDKGTVWTNGIVDLYAERNYDREPARLRSLMEQVREARRRKEAEKRREEERLDEAARRLATNAAKPEAANAERIAVSPPVFTAEKSGFEKKLTVRKKVVGPERLYIFGRMRHLFAHNVSNAEIAENLTAEGCKRGDGSEYTASTVGQIRNYWTMRPDREKAYKAIAVPRGGAKKEPDKATPSTSRFGLPATVEAVLADPEITDDERFYILNCFLEMPESAGKIMADTNINAKQKLAVAEALGKAKPRPQRG